MNEEMDGWMNGWVNFFRQALPFVGLLSVDEVSKVSKSKKMMDAEKFDVPVVSEDYLDAVKTGNARLMISQHSIAPWGKNKVL